MTTQLVYSSELFGKGYITGGGGSGTTVTVRRGTLTADTWDDPDLGIRATILLDGNEEASEYGVDWRMSEGQRVLVLFFGAQAVVLPVASAIIEQAVDQAYGLAYDDMQEFVDQLVADIEEVKEQATSEVSGLRESFESFKEEHQLTDNDITLTITQTQTSLESLIEGVKETADAAYSATTSISQTVYEISLTASEKYEEYDAGFIDLQAQITVASDRITQEVTDRTEAISGAVVDLQSQITQTANSILSTVAGTYVTSDGLAAEVSTQVEQTTSGWSVQINNAINTANSASSAASSAQSAASSAQSTANAAQSAAEDAARTATDYLEYSTSGLTLGRKVNGEYTGIKTRITTSAYTILDDNDNEISSFGADNVNLGNILNISVDSNSAELYTNYTTMSLVNSGGSNIALDSTILLAAREYVRFNASAMINGYIPSGTTQQYAIGAVVLFSNASGATGSVTLSYQASYFSILEIVYGDGTRYYTKRIYSPNGKYISLDRSVYSGSTMYLASQIYSINGTAVTIQSSNSGQADFSSSGNSVGSVTALSIYQIIGWR